MEAKATGFFALLLDAVLARRSPRRPSAHGDGRRFSATVQMSRFSFHVDISSGSSKRTNLAEVFEGLPTSPGASPASVDNELSGWRGPAESSSSAAGVLQCAGLAVSLCDGLCVRGVSVAHSWHSPAHPAAEVLGGEWGPRSCPRASVDGD